MTSRRAVILTAAGLAASGLHPSSHAIGLGLLGLGAIGGRAGRDNGRGGGRDPAPVEGLSAQSWVVAGDTRQALVHSPTNAASNVGATSAKPWPVVFAFHGHSGNARAVASKYNFHTLWPEALVVYPQGLPSPGKYDPEGQTAGWQKQPGAQNDRDIAFFDAMLASLGTQHNIDAKRVYAMGHSNGGGFTYVLSATRGQQLAAIAPSSCGAGGLFDSFKPLPTLHVAGQADDSVPFENQLRTMRRIRTINRCVAASQPWANEGSVAATVYPSEINAPFVEAIHPGTHKYPQEASALIARFFKDQVKLT